MNTGRRIANPASKKLAGTYRADRHGEIVPIASVSASPPIAPEWLTTPAKAVWDMDLPRVIATGATSVDSQMFALYCTTMADFIASVQAREPANAAFRSELRKQMELLGIAGAKSRLAKIASATPQPTNPFTVRK